MQHSVAQLPSDRPLALLRATPLIAPSAPRQARPATMPTPVERETVTLHAFKPSDPRFKPGGSQGYVLASMPHARIVEVPAAEDELLVSDRPAACVAYVVQVSWYQKNTADPWEWVTLVRLSNAFTPFALLGARGCMANASECISIQTPQLVAAFRLRRKYRHALPQGARDRALRRAHAAERDLARRIAERTEEQLATSPLPYGGAPGLARCVAGILNGPWDDGPIAIDNYVCSSFLPGWDWVKRAPHGTSQKTAATRQIGD